MTLRRVSIRAFADSFDISLMSRTPTQTARSNSALMLTNASRSEAAACAAAFC